MFETLYLNLTTLSVFLKHMLQISLQFWLNAMYVGICSLKFILLSLVYKTDTFIAGQEMYEKYVILILFFLFHRAINMDIKLTDI